MCAYHIKTQNLKGHGLKFRQFEYGQKNIYLQNKINTINKYLKLYIYFQNIKPKIKFTLIHSTKK